jgi:hypothetical protein
MRMTIEEDVDIYLSKLWNLITIERPKNHHDIVRFCVKDIEEAADPDSWTSEDIEIAFRRFLESKERTL